MTTWLQRRDFASARRLVDGAVHRTPMLPFRTLGRLNGTRPWLKCENLQKTGSFKVRGALAAIAALDRAEQARGVITISAGNHAQAVAWAAGRVGARAVVVMPETAARTKVAAAIGYGADVVLHGDAADAFGEARRRADEEGLVFLHPFDAEPVIAGHGSTGLEVGDDVPGEAVIVVPVGGRRPDRGDRGGAGRGGKTGRTGTDACDRGRAGGGARHAQESRRGPGRHPRWRPNDRRRVGAAHGGRAETTGTWPSSPKTWCW